MTSASPQWAFEGYRLWRTIYDKRVLTEDGAYLEGNVPPSYAGPELEIEYNQIIIFANSAGRFIELRTLQYSELLDDEDRKGVGYTYTLYETEFTVEPAGPSDVKATWHVRDSDNFSEEEAARIDYLYRKYLRDRGDLE